MGMVDSLSAKVDEKVRRGLRAHLDNTITSRFPKLEVRNPKQTRNPNLKTFKIDMAIEF
jgi:hypothetical protein